MSLRVVSMPITMHRHIYVSKGLVIEMESSIAERPIQFRPSPSSRKLV